MRRPLKIFIAVFLTVGVILLCLGAFKPGADVRSVNPTRLSAAPGQSGMMPQQYGRGSVKIGKNVNVSNEPGAQAETSVAVDPTDPLHIVTSVNDCTGNISASAYESTDGGLTFNSTYRSPSADTCLDNWDAFNLNGDAFIAYDCLDKNASDQRIAYRQKGQSIWTEIKLSMAGVAPDRDMVIVDNSLTSPLSGSVYIGYIDSGTNNTPYVLYSRNGIDNWNRSTAIGLDGAIGVNVATAPDGAVYATWEDFLGKKIWVAASNDGAATFGTPQVATNYRIDTTKFSIFIPPQNVRGVVPMPFTAVAPATSANAGRLYVSYLDQEPNGSNTNIYVRYSDDGGTTWSNETKVNDDINHAYHFHNAISIAASGTVGVSFYDTRRDAKSHKTDRYISLSTDGGNTWAPNKRVTSKQSDVTKTQDGSQYGDYQGSSVGADGLFHLSWTDARKGDQSQDLFAGTAK